MADVEAKLIVKHVEVIATHDIEPAFSMEQARMLELLLTVESASKQALELPESASPAIIVPLVVICKTMF